MADVQALEPASGNVATRTTAEPFQAHGWSSAVLTPFHLTSGHAPDTANQIVLGSGVAASTGLRIGSAVRLARQDLPAFTPGCRAHRDDGRTAAHPPAAPAVRPASPGRRAALCILMMVATFSTQLILTFALPAGLLFLAAIALLGPVLVSLAELLVRFPLLLLSEVGGRLALADIRRRPRRMASAVSAVAIGVALISAEYLPWP